jgi:hypothetical protein
MAVEGHAEAQQFLGVLPGPADNADKYADASRMWPALHLKGACPGMPKAVPQLNAVSVLPPVYSMSLVNYSSLL